jgi:hypothetical protein
MADSDKPRLVYGEVTDYQLVFIPKSQAQDLAAVQGALAASETWEEFEWNLPYRYWLQVVENLEEPLPAGKDRFNRNDVPGVEDGYWPEWPAHEMLNWMPRDIQDRFGEVGRSMVNDDCLLIDPKSEREVVAAVEDAGYVCVRDDELVKQASGY